MENIENPLPHNWFIQEPIDYEHKYYVMLNFLQKIGKNAINGCIYTDFLTLKDRLDDILCFVDNGEIVGNLEVNEFLNSLDKESDDYGEIVDIINSAYVLFSDIYESLISDIKDIYKSLIIVDKRSDKRKRQKYFIQNSVTDLVEVYSVGKSNIEFVGEVDSSDCTYLYDEDNYVHIINDNLLSNENTIIPLVKLQLQYESLIS